jgi:hypothetical protein
MRSDKMMTLEELQARVNEEKEYVGIKQYSHNIVSLLLQETASRFGKAEANRIIEEEELEVLGWHKVKI